MVGVAARDRAAVAPTADGAAAGNRRAPDPRSEKRRRAASGAQRGRGNCVKILLPETELQGLAGRGEQTVPGPPHPPPPGGHQIKKGVDSAAARNPLPSSPTFSLPPAFSPSAPSSNPNPPADAASQSDPPARPSWNPGF